MKFIWLCAVLLCIPCHPVKAEEWNNERIQVALERVSTRWGVPPLLVRAIMDVESSAHPWTVNVEGKDLYPRKSEDALRLVRTALARGESVDVGLMQINSYWIYKLRLSPDIVLDPFVNLTVGAWILAQELKRYGNNWKGVGSYHTPASRNPVRAKKYAERVYKKMGGHRNE